MKKLYKILTPIFVILFWVLLWEILSLAVSNEILLPSPLRVAESLIWHLSDGEYYLTVLSSVLRILAGYIVGIVSGAFLALLTFTLKTADTLLSPFFTAIRATPVASFIILALVWMGRELVPSFTSFLMVMPVVYANVKLGLSSADKKLIEVSKIYFFSYFKKLKLLYIPSAIPSFLTGAVLSLGLAWKAGVAAEVLCSLKNSIGGNINESKIYLESVDLMVWTVTVIALSILLELLLRKVTEIIRTKYMRKEDGDVVGNQ